MARPPSYPKDAPVAPPPGAPEAPSSAGNAPRPARTPKSPKPHEPSGAAEATPADSKRTKHLVAGAAIGIGSAALVAALLYANRNRSN
jgi:hypothetical protein